MNETNETKYNYTDFLNCGCDVELSEFVDILYAAFEVITYHVASPRILVALQC